MPDEITGLQVQLRRDYWSAKFPSKIKSSLDGRLNSEQIYNCTQSLSHQPPIQYRINFIKAVIKQLESKWLADETAKWYDCLESISASTIQTEPFYRLYEVHQEETLTLQDHQSPIKIYEDEKAFVSDGSTGNITWIACLELAKWIGTIGQSMDCCWAFELGCGTGLLAISLVKQFCQLKHYRASDAHLGVLERCRRNVTANKLDGQIEVTQLDWIRDENKFPTYFQDAVQKYAAPGILLGADIIFDVSVIESLRKIIAAFLTTKPRGRAILSAAIRNEKTMESFQDEIRRNDMEIQIVHTWECCDGVHGAILEIRQKNPSL